MCYRYSVVLISIFPDYTRLNDITNGLSYQRYAIIPHSAQAKKPLNLFLCVIECHSLQICGPAGVFAHHLRKNRIRFRLIWENTIWNETNWRYFPLHLCFVHAIFETNVFFLSLSVIFEHLFYFGILESRLKILSEVWIIQT